MAGEQTATPAPDATASNEQLNTATPDYTGGTPDQSTAVEQPQGTPAGQQVPSTAVAPPPRRTFGEGFTGTLAGPQYTTDEAGNLRRAELPRRASLKGFMGSILAGALQGAAAGLGGKPAYEGESGAVVGARAAGEFAQNRELQARQIAQQSFENTQKAQQTSRENLEATARMHLENMEANDISQRMEIASKMLPGQLNAQALQAYNYTLDGIKQLKELVGTTTPLMTWPNATTAMASDQYRKMLLDPNVRVLPTLNSDGSIGIGAYPASWDHQVLTEDRQIQVGWQYDTKTGKVVPMGEKSTVPKGSENKDWLALQTESNKNLDNALNQQREFETAQAQANEANARTTLINRQADMLVQDNSPNVFGDTNDNPGGIPMMPKDRLNQFKDFQDKVIVPLQATTDKAYNMSVTAYNEWKAANGNLPTGAQSMMMLSNHLSTTFGNVKGARVTKDMIHEHLGARDITDDALVAVQRITQGGQVLSPAQWGAFMSLIGQSRTFSYYAAIDNARSRGIAKTIPLFLPKPAVKDMAPDVSTIQIYGYAAHGDAKVTADALKSAGWGNFVQ